MPREALSRKAHIQGIQACLTSALAMLEELNKAFTSPFIEAIGKSIEALIDGIQAGHKKTLEDDTSLKSNKDKCFQLVHRIHEVLYAIIGLHIKPGTVGSLPLSMVDHVKTFIETLHKICTFIGAHQKGNRIKQLFRQSEVNTLLEDCNSGLDQAMQVFKLQPGYMVFTGVVEVQQQAEDMHNSLLELVAMSSDSTVSDQSSSIFYMGINGSQNSSNSFCMLPPKPKIFHGLESELEDIVQILAQDSPRVAILGGGGMGKTSLAQAVLHHPDTCAKFQERFFVSAEATPTASQLATLTGLHLGLEPSRDDTKAVFHSFVEKSSSCLLILDNLETPWEPREFRSGVEDFLSLLADVKHLALIITMRGSERPGKVQWTRPFLPPLQPLSDDAAREIFNDITDDSSDSEEKLQLLRFTENMPLAVDLMAHLVDHEGLYNVLARWQAEKTTSLSIGHHKNSNLDASITTSFSSPRITAGAKKLLSLLSVLPDGLLDIELVQINTVIPGIHSCKSALLATSLAYKDTSSRLRSLVPIREHIRRFYPPPQSLVHLVRKCFHELLACVGNTDKLGNIITQITANVANLDDILRQGLQPESAELFDTNRCIIALNSFYRPTRTSQVPLLHLARPGNHRLEVLRIVEQLCSTQDLICQGISHFQHFSDCILESRFYLAAGTVSFNSKHVSQALQFFERALALSRSSDGNGESDALTAIAYVKWCTKDYPAALTLGREAQLSAHRTGNLWQELRALGQMAMCFTSLGNYQAAINGMHRARNMLPLDVCGISGGYFDRRMMMNLAELHLQKSEYAEAQHIYTTQIQDNLSDLDPLFYGVALLHISEIDVAIGTNELAIRENLDKAEAKFTHARLVVEVTYCEVISAELMLRQGQRASAAFLFQKHIHSGWGVNNQVVSRCLLGLCQCDVLEAHPKFSWPVVYLAFAQRLRARLAIHQALLLLGVFLANQDEEIAENLFTVALEGFTSMDIHRSRAQCMTHLGDLANKRKDKLQAEKLWKLARPLFDRTLQSKDVTGIDERLREGPQ